MSLLLTNSQGKAFTVNGNALSVERGPGYVTDGLIHWLDGIEKGASDGTWVDKVGGHVYTTNGALPIANGFRFDGSKYFYNSTFNVETTPTGNTIEIVLSDAQVGSDGYCLFTSHATAYTDKRLYVAFVGSKSKICLSAAKTHPMYNYTSAEDIKSIVSCPDGRCYINNVPSVSDENNYYNCTGTANRIGCGYYSGSARHFYKGNIHAIRIYNRSLTAEEVAHNYALDLMRFRPIIDKEVEYLENNDYHQEMTVYQNSTSGAFSSFDFEIRQRFSVLPTSGYIGSGITSGSGVQFFVGVNAAEATGIYMCFAPSSTNTVARQLANSDKYGWHTYRAVSDGTTCTYYVDGEQVFQHNNASVNIGTTPIKLFRMTNSTISNGKQQISYMKFSRNGELVCDLCPMRSGQTGYMYNRVSGRIDINTGTGDFIIGPDITNSNQ